MIAYRLKPNAFVRFVSSKTDSSEAIKAIVAGIVLPDSVNRPSWRRATIDAAPWSAKGISRDNIAGAAVAKVMLKPVAYFGRQDVGCRMRVTVMNDAYRLEFTSSLERVQRSEEAVKRRGVLDPIPLRLCRVGRRKDEHRQHAQNGANGDAQKFS